MIYLWILLLLIKIFSNKLLEPLAYGYYIGRELKEIIMDKIKSAWEIALEKTKGIRADRNAFKENWL